MRLAAIAVLVLEALLVVSLTGLPIPATGPLKVAYIQSYDVGYAESDSVVFYLVNISNGEIGHADIVNGHTSNITLANLTTYDVLFVAADFSSWFDKYAINDALADFIEAGGAIVGAFFPLGTGDCFDYATGATGRFAQNYLVFNGAQCLYESTSDGSLGKLEFPNHPIMASVQNFTSTSFGTPLANATFVSGSYVVARWDTPEKNPLVAVRDNVGPYGLSRVDLGFWPNRDTVYPNTGIQQLEVNAILYAAGRLSYFNFTTVNTCTVPDASALAAPFLASGETVTQTPAAGTTVADGSTNVTVTVHSADNTQTISRTFSLACDTSSATSDLLANSIWHWLKDL